MRRTDGAQDVPYRDGRVRSIQRMGTYVAIKKHEPIWRFIGISAIIHILLLALFAERLTQPSITPQTTGPMSPRLEVAILPEPRVELTPSRYSTSESGALDNAATEEPRHPRPILPLSPKSTTEHAQRVPSDELGSATGDESTISPQQTSRDAVRLIQSGLDYARNIPPKDTVQEAFTRSGRAPPTWLLERFDEPDPPGLVMENEQIDLEIVDYGSIDGLAKVKVAYPGHLPYCLEFDLAKHMEELDERMVLATRGTRCK